MSEDIVARLYRLDADHCGVINGLGEAAREIERLRAINTDLVAALADMIADNDDVEDGKLPRISFATVVRARQAKARGEQT